METNGKRTMLQALTEPFKALQNKVFAKLYLAQTISLVGDAFTWVGLALLVYQISKERSSAIFATALTLRVTAFIIFSPFAGVAADRIDCKKILYITHFIRMGIICCLPFINAEWNIYLLVFLLNIFNAFFTPTYRAVIPQIIEGKYFKQTYYTMKQLIIISTALIFLSACGNSKQEEKQPEKATNENIAELSDAQMKNAGIETGKLEQHAISAVLKVNGVIDVPPQNMVSISVPLGGYLKSTKLLAGMHISKGEAIAIMEDQQYIQLQQDYLTAKAQFTYNESEFNRQRELNQSKATSDKVFEQTKAAYETQSILIRSLEEKLKLIKINPAKLTPATITRSINIYSPINGFVSEVNVNIGKYVNPSDVLFELVNPTDIHLALTVFEKDMDKLFIGQKLIAYSNNQPDKRYPCTIILISKNLSGERSAEVHCHFEQYDKNLLPGMFMNADIEVKSNNVNALPNDAIVRFENKQYAFIARGNNQFEMTEIKAGINENGFSEVTIENKFADQTFVLKGAYNLLMKLKNTSEE